MKKSGLGALIEKCNGHYVFNVNSSFKVFCVHCMSCIFVATLDNYLTFTKLNHGSNITSVYLTFPYKTEVKRSGPHEDRISPYLYRPNIAR